MKRFLICIIIILLILLIGQVIFFNSKSNTKISEENIIINSTENTNSSNMTTNELEDTNNMQKQDIIIPSGINLIMERYKGNVDENYLEQEFYKFINTNVKQIYNLTTRKSINKILQIYDLNTDEINNMHIYSSNDFLEIATQTYRVANISGVKYSTSIAAMSSYNEDENGYSTFSVTFNYSNDDAIKLKVYLANSESITPQIKFGVIEENE